MLTALYDGNCALCRSTCRALRVLDWRRRIVFVDLHNSGGWAGVCAEIGQERLLGALHVLDAERRVYAGFLGLRRLLKEVPLGFPLWLLLQLPGADALGRRAYRFIARRRYRLNRLLGCADGACQLPR